MKAERIQGFAGTSMLFLAHADSSPAVPDWTAQWTHSEVLCTCFSMIFFQIACPKDVFGLSQVLRLELPHSAFELSLRVEAVA